MKTKHTPAPWIVFGKSYKEYPNIPESKYIFQITTEQSNGGVQIAKVNTSKFYEDETSIANAHLIASAPELLEACKKAFTFIGEYAIESGDESLETEAIQELLFKTINKAEGV